MADNKNVELEKSDSSGSKLADLSSPGTGASPGGRKRATSGSSEGSSTSSASTSTLSLGDEGKYLTKKSGRRLLNDVAASEEKPEGSDGSIPEITVDKTEDKTRTKLHKREKSDGRKATDSSSTDKKKQPKSSEKSPAASPNTSKVSSQPGSRKSISTSELELSETGEVVSQASTGVLTLHFSDGTFKALRNTNPSDNVYQNLQKVCITRGISLDDKILVEHQKQKKVKWNKETTFAMLAKVLKSEHVALLTKEEWKEKEEKDKKEKRQKRRSILKKSREEKEAEIEKKKERMEAMDAGSQSSDSVSEISVGETGEILTTAHADNFTIHFADGGIKVLPSIHPTDNVFQTIQKVCVSRGLSFEEKNLVDHKTKKIVKWDKETTFATLLAGMKSAQVEIVEKEEEKKEKRERRLSGSEVSLGNSGEVLVPVSENTFSVHFSDGTMKVLQNLNPSDNVYQTLQKLCVSRGISIDNFKLVDHKTKKDVKWDKEATFATLLAGMKSAQVELVEKEEEKKEKRERRPSGSDVSLGNTGEVLTPVSTDNFAIYFSDGSTKIIQNLNPSDNVYDTLQKLCVVRKISLDNSNLVDHKTKKMLKWDKETTFATLLVGMKSAHLEIVEKEVEKPDRSWRRSSGYVGETGEVLAPVSTDNFSVHFVDGSIKVFQSLNPTDNVYQTLQKLCVSRGISLDDHTLVVPKTTKKIKWDDKTSFAELLGNLKTPHVELLSKEEKRRREGHSTKEEKDVGEISISDSGEVLTPASLGSFTIHFGDGSMKVFASVNPTENVYLALQKVCVARGISLDDKVLVDQVNFKKAKWDKHTDFGGLLGKLKSANVGVYSKDEKKEKKKEYKKHEKVQKEKEKEREKEEKEKEKERKKTGDDVLLADQQRVAEMEKKRREEQEKKKKEEYFAGLRKKEQEEQAREERRKEDELKAKKQKEDEKKYQKDDMYIKLEGAKAAPPTSTAAAPTPTTTTTTTTTVAPADGDDKRNQFCNCNCCSIV